MAKRYEAVRVDLVSAFSVLFFRSLSLERRALYSSLMLLLFPSPTLPDQLASPLAVTWIRLDKARLLPSLQAKLQYTLPRNQFLQLVVISHFLGNLIQMLRSSTPGGGMTVLMAFRANASGVQF